LIDDDDVQLVLVRGLIDACNLTAVFLLTIRRMHCTSAISPTDLIAQLLSPHLAKFRH